MSITLFSVTFGLLVY